LQSLLRTLCALAGEERQPRGVVVPQGPPCMVPSICSVPSRHARADSSCHHRSSLDLLETFLQILPKTYVGECINPAVAASGGHSGITPPPCISYNHNAIGRTNVRDPGNGDSLANLSLDRCGRKFLTLYITCVLVSLIILFLSQLVTRRRNKKPLRGITRSSRRAASLVFDASKVRWVPVSLTNTESKA
jgi:hypothetical protein